MGFKIFRFLHKQSVKYINPVRSLGSKTDEIDHVVSDIIVKVAVFHIFGLDYSVFSRVLSSLSSLDFGR